MTEKKRITSKKSLTSKLFGKKPKSAYSVKMYTISRKKRICITNEQKNTYVLNIKSFKLKNLQNLLSKSSILKLVVVLAAN